jgi:hypothetical protein
MLDVRCFNHRWFKLKDHRNMKKYMLFIKLASCFYLPSFAQLQRDRDDQDREPPAKQGFDKSKLFIGGNFGLSFGDYTFINISPQLGYRFNEYFAAGAGVNFQYSSIKSYYGDVTRTSYGVTGLNIFGRVYPIKYLMLQAQPEMNYVWGNFKDYTQSTSEKIPGKPVPSLLLGGGAVIPQGRGAVVISIQFDVLHENQSPYGTQPIYNFGYNIGL